MSAVDYGYGDAAPDTADYGYGDAAPDTADYGYGDAAPDTADYGYGDAAPDTTDYGYGDATPDSTAVPAPAADYGYGDATPDSADYGYGDAAPDSGATPDDPNKYGYGDATPNDDAGKYGYGDASPNDAAQYGYGDGNAASHRGDYETGLNDDSAKSGGGLQPRNRKTPDRTYSADEAMQSTRRKGGGRYRRRGSVTKFSLDTADEVKKEYDEAADLIDKFRKQAKVSSTLARTPSTDSVNNSSEQFSDSGESNDNDLDDNAVATKKMMKKKSKRFMKFGSGRRGSK